MSYHRLFWFTLSFVEWWVRWRKDTCHLPVFLLRVPISLLASKCLAWQSPTPGVVIQLRQTIPHNSSPKSPLCAYSFQKGSKVLHKFSLKILVSGRTWSNLLKKKNDENKYPWSLSKEFERGVQIKWPKNISKCPTLGQNFRPTNFQ